jgi:predicted MPP superfamily phosphohydrolase
LTSSVVRRVTGVVLVALVGTWLGLLVAGRVTQDVGPVQTTMALRPSLVGDTQVDVAPLGALSLDSHDGPVALTVSVRRLDPEEARGIVDDPAVLDGLGKRVVDDVLTGLTRLAAVAGLAAVSGALITGGIVFRRLRPTLAAGGVALALALLSGVVSVLTWNPASIAQPRYSGLLASAPQVVGSAESIVENFDRYREQLAKLVTNVSDLYEAASTLPTYSPDDKTLRVLHVSDIHLNPAAFDVIASVVTQFHVDVVIDSGDFTDHGSAVEDRFAGLISKVSAPYVWVRGNHDSMSTQRAVARQPTAIVLDGNTREVASLRIAGIGDPRFTPDKQTRDGDGPGDTDDLVELGNRFAEQLAEAEPRPDIVVTHDPTAAQKLDGVASLLLAGHAHKRRTEVLPGGSRLMIQGSTGGAGLRGLETEDPTPIALSVLYLDRDTKRLQAWDEITLGGFGITSAEIQRKLAAGPGVTSDRSELQR